MYDSNLIYYLKSELNDMADSQIDKSKIQDSERYFQLHEIKRQKLLRNYDFTQISVPKEFLTLTLNQRISLKEFVKVFCVDSSDFERYLRLICRVGFCCERADMSKTIEYQAILSNYVFLKELWQEAYPTSFSEFENQKRECVIEAIKPQQARPLCKHCGSDSVVSNGLNWYCKSCGKQFSKHPQKQPVKQFIN